MPELRILRIIAYVLYAVIGHLLSVTVTIEEIILKGKVLVLNLGLLRPPLITYLVGTYLTPLPNYIVLPLTLATFFIGLKKVVLFYGVVMIYTFFHVLVI